MTDTPTGAPIKSTLSPITRFLPPVPSTLSQITRGDVITFSAAFRDGDVAVTPKSATLVVTFPTREGARQSQTIEMEQGANNVWHCDWDSRGCAAGLAEWYAKSISPESSLTGHFTIVEIYKPPPDLTPAQLALPLTMGDLGTWLAPAIADQLLSVVGPLRARIQALEKSQTKLAYGGVWKADREYDVGTLCTFDGSLWHANTKTSDRPGTSGEWTLAVKRGRDAK